MVPFSFKRVYVESFALDLPPYQVSSAEIEDRIAPLYERLKIPFGTLEKLSGVKTRHLWKEPVMPSDAATVAAKQALESVEFDHDLIKAVFNCSVVRDYFEPATASLIHKNLGLTEDAFTMDISNACIGFSNGMLKLASLIESGVVKAGIVVSAENISPIVDSTIDHLLKNDDLGRDELLKLLPSFTLGSGAAAFVMCDESIATSGHRLVGAATRGASQHSDLCNGNGDYCMYTIAQGGAPLMYTESQTLIPSAAKLGGRAWKDASEALGWSRDDVDHIFCHQVGKQVNEAFYKEMDLDISKEFTVYQRYGNLVSAALPSAVITGAKEKGMQSGDKVLLTAFGSGLNAIFSGLIW